MKSEVILSYTVREACRRWIRIDGADAQALEHALTITERERDDAQQERDDLKKQLDVAHEAVGSFEMALTTTERERDKVRQERDKLLTDMRSARVDLAAWEGASRLGDRASPANLRDALDDNDDTAEALVVARAELAEAERDRFEMELADLRDAIAKLAGGVALLWSAMRAEQIKALPPEAP